MQGFDPMKVRAHRRAQAEAGFPLLRGCAGTQAIALVNYLDGASDAERVVFTDQFSEFDHAESSDGALTPAALAELLGRYPLLAQHYGAFLGGSTPVARAPDVRRLPVKVLAGVMKDAQVGGLDGWMKLVGLSDDPAARAPPAAHAPSLEEIVPVAPQRLRKLIGDAMRQSFAAQDRRITSDHTQYAASIPGGNIKVDVLFARGSGATEQFNYHLGADVAGRPPVWMGSYEGLWRLPSRWNYVTEANADRSIAHLVRLIEACVAMV